MPLTTNQDTECINSNRIQDLPFAVVNSSLFCCNAWLNVLLFFLLPLSVFANISSNGLILLTKFAKIKFFLSLYPNNVDMKNRNMSSMFS